MRENGHTARRRTLLAGATAAAGLTALGTALPSTRTALADTGRGDRTVPRALAEPSASNGLVLPELRFDVVAVTGDPREADAAVRFETADGLDSWNPVHLRTGGRDDRGDDLWEAEFHPVRALTVHRTAMPTGDDHAADVREVYYLPAVQQAWGDTGYRVLIDPGGVVYEGRRSGGDGVPVLSGLPRPGRAGSVTAGHAYGFDQGNVGVCPLGDFTEELPTQAAQDSLVDVLRVLCAVTGVDPAGRIGYADPGTGVTTSGDAVSRHRDWLETECPGNAFSEVFDNAVRQRVIAGPA
ncbi:peptidoglycan recognition family protein [Nocardiopsis sp. RV163]|uniref:peptidoglycan recognition protein family protein n=1 Tax=Nocardiopsis sp. RV163 TaxID=1661388 RepID=UPI00064C31C3|nr:peptidoglycan recognition family protein [Nocardiopsis sp. RV163]